MNQAEIISPAVRAGAGTKPGQVNLSWAQIAVVEPALAHTLSLPTLEFKFPATIGAGCTIHKALWFGHSLSPAETADVVLGAKLIFVYGRLEYSDTFRRCRWSNFRLQYSGVFPPRPDAMLLFSEGGNESN